MIEKFWDKHKIEYPMTVNREYLIMDQYVQLVVCVVGLLWHFVGGLRFL